jgi:hypothetical protein
MRSDDRRAHRAGRRTALLLGALLAASCGEGRDLRGRSEPSHDGATWLAIEDDNGGSCAPLLVDGEPWPHAAGVPGRVRPGPHRIACGRDDPGLEVSVQAGTVFHFDYWGP